MPSFVLTRLDIGPQELAAVLPLRARVVRVMPGPDRPDYVLCYPEKPIPYRGADANADVQPVDVQAIVVCTRMVGDAFRAGMTDLAVNIAYVLDNSLTHETHLDFAKVAYAAIGFVDDSPIEVPLPEEA